ncbi:hypothetical protein WMF37_30025 [Sorangium sp. So ce291]|uniref:hypothetical protein n=1 Tax=Sorangium sp. So ce291 TaxID=3133294 RepID=UPI003F6220C1
MNVVHHSSRNGWIAGGFAASLLVLLAGCSDQALGAPVPASGAEPPPRDATAARPSSTARVIQGQPAPRPAAPQAAPLERDALLREAGRLAEIRAVLARSPEAPLSLLDEHRAEFPQGQLAAERELIAIDALLRRGDADRARARAEAFLAQFRSSPHAGRVRRLTSAAP